MCLPCQTLVSHEPSQASATGSHMDQLLHATHACPLCPLACADAECKHLDQCAANTAAHQGSCTCKHSISVKFGHRRPRVTTCKATDIRKGDNTDVSSIQRLTYIPILQRTAPGHYVAFLTLTHARLPTPSVKYLPLPLSLAHTYTLMSNAQLHAKSSSQTGACAKALHVSSWEPAQAGAAASDELLSWKWVHVLRKCLTSKP